MCLPPWIYYGVDRRETPSSLPCANILHCFKISCQLLKVNIRVSSFSGVIILSRLKCLWILNLSTKVLVLHEVTLWATASQLHINCSGARTSREKTQRGKWRFPGDLLTEGSETTVGRQEGFPGHVLCSHSRKDYCQHAQQLNILCPPHFSQHSVTEHNEQYLIIKSYIFL